MKYRLPDVSKDAADLIHSGRSARTCFLSEIADSWDDVKAFSKKYKTKLRLIDVSTETRGLEPLYVFSDDLGGYTAAGIRASL